MHVPACDGFHPADVSCTEQAAARADADPWLCAGATRSGHHWFAERLPGVVCGNDGCGRAWDQLEAPGTTT